MSAIPLWFLPLIVFEAVCIIGCVAYIVETNSLGLRPSEQAGRSSRLSDTEQVHRKEVL